MANDAGAAPTSTARRQSCDRCHNQKVRCIRPDNRKDSPCDRCLRKGEQCAYSSCLPKGRPSLYRLNDLPVGSRGREPSVGSKRTTAPGPVAQPGQRTNQQAQRARQQPDEQALGDLASASPADSVADLTKVGSVNVEIDMHDTTFVPAAGSIDDTLPDFPALWGPDDHLVASPALEQDPAPDPAAEPHQTLAGLDFAGHFANLSDWLTAETGHAHACFNGLSISTTTTTDTGDDSSMPSSSSRGDAVLSPAERSGFEPIIAQLSRLSTHLSQLLGPSRSFLSEMGPPSRASPRNQGPALRVQSGIKAVFKSANAWLVQEPANADATLGFSLRPANSCDLLQDVFSASNQLLDIMRHVHHAVSTRPGTPSLFGSLGASSPETGSSLAAGFGGEPTVAAANGHNSYSVMCHLVLACMTLLLNMYTEILMALQRSAEDLNSSLLRRRPGHLQLAAVEPGDGMGSASRVQLQLVCIVQMCSYFLRRLNQAWGIILAGSEGSPLHTATSVDNDPWQSVAAGAMGALKTEVEQRLRRLQENLDIIP